MKKIICCILCGIIFNTGLARAEINWHFSCGLSYLSGLSDVNDVHKINMAYNDTYSYGSDDTTVFPRSLLALP